MHLYQYSTACVAHRRNYTTYGEQNTQELFVRIKAAFIQAVLVVIRSNGLVDSKEICLRIADLVMDPEKSLLCMCSMYVLSPWAADNNQLYN